MKKLLVISFLYLCFSSEMNAQKLASVSTLDVSSVTGFSANVDGNVTDDGGATVTERGIVWGTTKWAAGSGEGTFTTRIIDLKPDRTYIVRAYAINSAGIAYGNEISLRTAKLPAVSTIAISSITPTGATVGGNVTNSGSATVIERGIVWDTAQNPTIALATKTNNGSGVGSYNCSITGLTLGRTYYARAYATSDAGTNYGEQLFFSTAQTVLDIVNNAINKNLLTEQNSKTGVSFIDSSLLVDGYKFIPNLKFQGIINPSIEGILHIARSYNTTGEDIEYVFKDSKVKSITIGSYTRAYVNFGDTITIELRDENFKGSAYKRRYNSNESILKNLLGLEIIKDFAYGKKIVNYGEWRTKYVENFLIGQEIYDGRVLNDGTIYKLEDDARSNLVLKRKSWISYTDNLNNEYPYNYFSISSDDTSFVVKKIVEFDNSKYLEVSKFKIMSLHKSLYKDNYFISSTSKHQIFKPIISDKYNSNFGSIIGTPLIINAERQDSNNIKLKYFFDNKLLFDGQIDNNGNLKDWCSIYSISANLFPLFYFKRLNLDAKSQNDNTNKVSLSFQRNTSDTKSYNENIDINELNPNSFAKNLSWNLFKNFNHLALSPLGIFNASLKKFQDKTPDFLSQKGYFEFNKKNDFSTLKILYQYLPDGRIYDSINVNKNEFGEQIGKSNLKDFPYGKDYMALLKRAQIEAEGAQIKILQEMVKESNTCDNCSKLIKTGKISVMEFKCSRVNNGKDYILDYPKKFCSPKCFSEYQKAWCDMQ